MAKNSYRIFSFKFSRTKIEYLGVELRKKIFLTPDSKHLKLIFLIIINFLPLLFFRKNFYFFFLRCF